MPTNLGIAAPQPLSSILQKIAPNGEDIRDLSYDEFLTELFAQQLTNEPFFVHLESHPVCKAVAEQLRSTVKQITVRKGDRLLVCPKLGVYLVHGQKVCRLGGNESHIEPMASFVDRCVVDTSAAEALLAGKAQIVVL